MIPINRKITIFFSLYLYTFKRSNLITKAKGSITTLYDWMGTFMFDQF